MLRTIGKGTGVAVSGVLAAAVIDGSQQRVSDGHTTSSAAYQYALHQTMAVMGAFGRWQLDRDCCDVKTVQDEFLARLLRDSAKTEYGLRFNFARLLQAGVSTTDEFRSGHPLTRFEHYSPYVQRMVTDPAARSLLTTEPVSRLGVTSGTSGSANMLPVVPEQRKIFFLQAHVSC